MLDDASRYDSVMGEIRVAVCGGASSPEMALQQAFQVGAGLARAGAVLLTGGGGGVMAAANRGARSEGGLTVGVLPGTGAQAPTPEMQLPIYTGIGQARNLVLVLSAEAVIAVGGEWGTLSEIALASKHGRPVIGLGTWNLTPPTGASLRLPTTANDAADAVALALQAARKNRT